MFPGQDFFLEYFGPAPFVYPCYLEDLCRVHVRVIPSAHHGDTANHALIHLERDATVLGGDNYHRGRGNTCTEEYTALYIFTGGCVLPGALGPACILSMSEEG